VHVRENSRYGRVSSAISGSINLTALRYLSALSKRPDDQLMALR
jgi:hypothetical protein